MTWFGFIHFHINGLNIRPHHRKRSTCNNTKAKKVKENFKVVHSLISLIGWNHHATSHIIIVIRILSDEI